MVGPKCTQTRVVGIINVVLYILYFKQQDFYEKYVSLPEDKHPKITCYTDTEAAVDRCTHIKV